MRTVALQLSSSHVSIRNIKSRLFVVIKSLITNYLFFSERVFKNAFGPHTLRYVGRAKADCVGRSWAREKYSLVIPNCFKHHPINQSFHKYSLVSRFHEDKQPLRHT